MENTLTFFADFIPILIVLVIWTSVWKGWALWRAARNNSLPWFIVLLLVNTLGILEILYIYVFSKDKAPELMKNIMTNAPKVEETKSEEKPESK